MYQLVTVHDLQSMQTSAAQGVSKSAVPAPLNGQIDVSCNIRGMAE